MDQSCVGKTWAMVSDIQIVVTKENTLYVANCEFEKFYMWYVTKLLDVPYVFNIHKFKQFSNDSPDEP